MIALIISMLITTTASADSVSTLNSTPIFYGLTGNNPEYKGAADKAQQAFFIQTGITQDISQAQSATQKQATSKSAAFIDSNTPFTSTEVFAVFGTAYAVGIKKQVTEKFKNPIIPTMTNTVSVSQGKGSLGFQLPF